MRNGPKSEPANKLTNSERQQVLNTANSPQYRNKSPKQIVPALADKGVYIASESTIYRILREADQMSHRGRSKAPSSQPPTERKATGPLQVWSWDITYLRSLIAGVFYYLYLFVDVWSRKIVAFEVHDVESSDLASILLEAGMQQERVESVNLYLHSDNGSPMKGATLKATMERLGVIASYSRPRVSDDNPYSEALFRTLKYCPQYPRKPFESLEQARTWVKGFVDWYNNEHLHSAIGFITPNDRHEMRADDIIENRKNVYLEAKEANPQRWSGRKIRSWISPMDVFLNPTKDTRIQLQRQKDVA